MASDPHSQSPSKLDSIILRNTLRYTLSAKEYKTFHDYLVSYSPKTIRRKVLPPQRYSSIVQTDGDSNAAAVRVSLRLLIALGTGLKLWDTVNGYVLARGKPKK